MMVATATFLTAALATLSPTNAPSSFGTETERTFACPTIVERDVWLDFDLDFTPSASNCVEVAFGADGDDDGVLTDSESRFSCALDCGSLVVCEADGMNLFSQTTDAHHLVLRLKSAKGQRPDSWRLEALGTQGSRLILAEGSFADDDVPLTGWSSARVRVSGPEAASAHIVARRSRHAFVITVR